MLTLRAAFVLILSFAAPAFGLTGPQGDAAILRGIVRVVDGDTLVLGAAKIRLFGIDAPETPQRCDPSGRNWACGTWATKTLRGLLDGADVRCVPQDRDRYGRIVARCLADGQDVASGMVRAGAAWAYRKYSQDYVADEAFARTLARGVWNGTTTEPGRYRKFRKRQPAPEGCAIKGNISRTGERIYHTPGQRDYDATRISPEKDERFFCTGAEAIAAGFRAARR